MKNLEDLYNTSRINQEKKLSKISKQLEVLEVTIRKLNNSSKKNVPKSSGLDKVLLVYKYLVDIYAFRYLLNRALTLYLHRSKVFISEDFFHAGQA